MKKNIKIVASLVILAFVFSSCKEDFLDADVTRYETQKRHEELTSDPTTVASVSKAAISKTYAIFQDFGDSHDDFGLKAFQLATDMMCEDIVIDQRQWFMYDYNLVNDGAAYRRTRSTWRQNYSIIAKINLHLETYFANETDDPKLLAAKAEPLAIRAIAFFNLVNFYQHTYKGHEDDLGVPLSLKSTDSKLPRAKVKEVYEQIIKDLTFAVEHGNVTSEHTDVDKSVAAAYLAKVYAQMEDWVNVEKYAIIAKQGAIDAVSVPGRSWNVAEKDILWGYDVNTQTSTLWASFWSHMDQFLPRGYAAGGSVKKIHNELYNKIPKEDSRRKLWANHDEYENIINQMHNADPKYDSTDENSGVAIADYDQFKFLAGNAEMEQDYCFLRVQDPILLEIEALVEQGKVGPAQALLTEFAQKRNSSFVAPADQNALREEVRFQRRIELWAEGTNWLDMKRWNLSINRLGAESNHWTKKEINTNDPKFLHKIPQGEIEANPNLKQNP